MAVAKRQAASSSGFEKKHDLPHHSQPWQPSSKMRTWIPFRKRRALLALVVLLIVYFFIKYLPTDVPSVGRRIDSRIGRTQGLPFALEVPQQAHHGDSKTLSSDQLYDGPVKFYNLASSLRIHAYNKNPHRDNLVFLLYDLRSAGTLVPLACELALYNRSTIHMSIVSRQDSSLSDIVAASGLKPEDCPIFWHDARPNYNSQSSKARQASVVKSAVSHLHAALRPAAFIVDQQQADNDLFYKALKERLAPMWVPAVVVPNDALTSLNWISSLDGTGISLLAENQIDIVIMPYKNSAGSLMRLLNSIQLADYTGLVRPRITVEIPHDIDHFALRWLENFRWPSSRKLGANNLILRRWIDTTQLTPTMASLRTLESFYPSYFPLSHVLVLSPDVELSPNYLQYLIYLISEYKHSRVSQSTASSLMGISLNLPKRSLDNKSPFTSLDQQTSHSLLLSQTPSGTATLYFGDKWVELQDYLSLRLKHDPTLARKISESIEISPSHPAWLRQASELMQARNYHMLYPAFTSPSTSGSPLSRLVTVHSELHQSPEEFAKSLDPDLNPVYTPTPNIPPPPSMYGEGAILTSSENDDDNGKNIDNPQPHAHARLDHEQQYRTPPRSLSAMLGLTGYQTLPPALDLPMFSADGEKMDLVEAAHRAEAYAERLSLEVGGCATLKQRDEMKFGQVGYLFCDAK